MQKTVLITGASSGIGRSLAILYAEDKCNLLLTGRNQERLSEVEEICKSKGAVVETSLIDVVDRDAFISQILNWDSKYNIDIVFANAGISGGTSVKRITEKTQFDDVIDTNIHGVFNTVNPLIPLMISRKQGQIVLLSSMAGFRGMTTAPAYSISKVAVKAYGDAIRATLANSNIKVSTVFPGFIRTAMTEVNDFKMPFLLEVEAAAEIIKTGVEKRKTYIAFPWQMHLISLAISLLPHKIYDLLLNVLPNK